jgi:hypothetical protein
LAVEQATRAEISQRFFPAHGGGRAQVTFPCDGLGARVREIVIERGGGHGGALSLWRAVRRQDGQYDVRAIAYHGASMLGPAANPPFELATGTVRPAGLETARAALSATVGELWTQPPGTVGGIRGMSSSRDFHLLVKLVDEDGRVLERRYTGYESSSSQEIYLGLQVANEALLPMTSLATSRRTPDAADRELFVERFMAAVPHFDEPFSWWVKQRYVDLARYLGTPAAI